MAGKALLTVVQSYYHQQEGMQPTQIEARYTRELKTDEQPYVRHFKVGETWDKLDTGWLTDCSLLIVKNNEGRFTDRIPTPAQLQEALARVVEIGLGIGPVSPCLLVHPNESHPLHVVSLDEVWLRCANGEARVSVMAFPR